MVEQLDLDVSNIFVLPINQPKTIAPTHINILIYVYIYICLL